MCCEHFFYSQTQFFYFVCHFCCSSVFGVRVYLAPFECIWRPFECIWSGSSVFGTRQIHSNGFGDGSSVFGKMRECIWRIRVYLARECIWRGGAKKKRTIYKVFVKSAKTLFFKIRNLRCVRVYLAAVRTYSADRSSVFGGIRQIHSQEFRQIHS